MRIAMQQNPMPLIGRSMRIVGFWRGLPQIRITAAHLHPSRENAALQEKRQSFDATLGVSTPDILCASITKVWVGVIAGAVGFWGGALLRLCQILFGIITAVGTMRDVRWFLPRVPEGMRFMTMAHFELAAGAAHEDRIDRAAEQS